MIIAPKFVLINFPKTGTTFVRTALNAVHGVNNSRLHRVLRKLNIEKPIARELLLPKLYGDYDASCKDQHGVYRQIPKPKKYKKIVTIIRNPLARYMSSYVFGWWKQHPPFPLEQVKLDFPDFPNLSFLDFYRLLNHPLVNEDKINISGARQYGNYTRMFLVFYSENPEDAVKNLLKGKTLMSVIPKITFLHQESLRDELYGFLKTVGYSELEAQRVYSIEDQNVGSATEKDAISKDELREVAQLILSDEMPLLEAFPRYYEYLLEF